MEGYEIVFSDNSYLHFPQRGYFPRASRILSHTTPRGTESGSGSREGCREDGPLLTSPRCPQAGKVQLTTSPSLPYDTTGNSFKLQDPRPVLRDPEERRGLCPPRALAKALLHPTPPAPPPASFRLPAIFSAWSVNRPAQQSLFRQMCAVCCVLLCLIKHVGVGS